MAWNDHTDKLTHTATYADPSAEAKEHQHG
jgi:hypothetical protein